jgi:hypothetical protein
MGSAALEEKKASSVDRSHTPQALFQVIGKIKTQNQMKKKNLKIGMTHSTSNDLMGEFTGQ